MERDKLLSTMDAKVWTDEFMATKAMLGDEEFDHAMMLAWFANAIMAGFDEANRRAQRALDAEREKVKELEEQLRLANCDQANTEADLNDVTAQLATLQAQLRQVEGERNTARHRVDELEAREIDVEILQGDLTTLQAQVEGLEQGCFIHHVDKEQAEMKIALLEGTIGMRATERIDLLSQLENTEAQLRQVEGLYRQQLDDRDKRIDELAGSAQIWMNQYTTLRQLVEALPNMNAVVVTHPDPYYHIGVYFRCDVAHHAMALAALLTYRATLAAQDAGKGDVSHE